MYQFRLWGESQEHSFHLLLLQLLSQSEEPAHLSFKMFAHPCDSERSEEKKKIVVFKGRKNLSGRKHRLKSTGHDVTDISPHMCLKWGKKTPRTLVSIVTSQRGKCHRLFDTFLEHGAGKRSKGRAAIMSRNIFHSIKALGI